MLNIKYDIVGSFLRPEPIKKAMMPMMTPITMISDMTRDPSIPPQQSAH